MREMDELVAAAQAGDKLAFTRLVEADARWAYGTVRAIVGFGGDAEDVFQEACLRAWRDLPKLRRPELWSPWFRRIVGRAAIDGARQRTRSVQLRLPTAEPHPDPAGAVADRDQVLRSLLTLKPDERAVLVMRFGHASRLRRSADCWTCLWEQPSRSCTARCGNCEQMEGCSECRASPEGGIAVGNQ